MALLDRLFSAFDGAATACGVYKVETIGDSYFAVAGMLPPRADHARAALRFALALHEAAAVTPVDPAAAGAPAVTLRVGLASGPVTSGVVGTLRARYCACHRACRRSREVVRAPLIVLTLTPIHTGVFGDVVNLSSRMESSGMEHGVQLSESCVAAARLPTSLLPGELVAIKGKGTLTTHSFTVGTGDPREAAVRAALAEPWADA